MIDPVDHRQVCAVRGSGDEYALGASRKMGRGLLLGSEDAGALEHDIDIEVLPRQLGGIPFGQHLEGVGADGDRVTLYPYIGRETAVHAIVTQKMRIGLDRAQVVDSDDIEILSAG